MTVSRTGLKRQNKCVPIQCHIPISGELIAEDVKYHMSIIPELVTLTTKRSTDDIQVGISGLPLSEDQENLRRLIWLKFHLLMGIGNILPP